MKNLLTISIMCFALVAMSFHAKAQKFAYVDTEYMLGKIPEYKQAQDQLDKLSADWQGEIAKKRSNIERLYNEYQAQEVLLTETLKKQKQDQILNLETDLQNYEQTKFGYEGELFQKRQELVKPIQDKIFEAVQQISKNRGYDFIFDKSTVTMLAFNEKYDMSDDVLKSMGY